MIPEITVPDEAAPRKQIRHRRLPGDPTIREQRTRDKERRREQERCARIVRDDAKRAAKVQADQGKKAKREKQLRSMGNRRDLPWILRAPRMLFLVLSGVLVFIITLVGMVESWRNLYEWGIEHHWGGYAVGVPVLVDFFILVGEMLLFVLIVDGRYGAFSVFTKIYLWVMFGFGLSLSLAGNIDHMRQVDIPSRIGFALPPLASAMGMAAILMVLKLIAEDYDMPAGEQQTAPPAQAEPEPAGTRTLVPHVAHMDQPVPVVQRVAHMVQPEPSGPKVDRRPVNGAARSTAVRSDPVIVTPAMDQAAKTYLAQLRREGKPFPSDRSLARTHFNHPDGRGAGNRRAARRVLAEFQPKEATA